MHILQSIWTYQTVLPLHAETKCNDMDMDMEINNVKSNLKREGEFESIIVNKVQKR